MSAAVATESSSLLNDVHVLGAPVMCCVAVFLTASIASAQTSQAGSIAPPLSPRNASYSIDVRLEPVTRTITASETITWRNISTKPVDELQFHVYWNAWRNASSTFMRERALAGASPNRLRTDWAAIDITSLTLKTPQGPVDLASSKRFIAPDDGNPDDATVMAVRLPMSIAPGAGVIVQVAWSAHVPRTFARTGAIG